MASVLPLPKYHQIYLVLREKLSEGGFAQGLPSEMALSQEFAAGRVTVRRALEQLANEGLIIRRAGRGTHPAPAPVERVYGASQAGRRRLASGMTGLLENIVSMSLRNIFISFVGGAKVRLSRWAVCCPTGG